MEGLWLHFWGGTIWGWDKEYASSKNLWLAIGFSLLGLGICLLTFINLSVSLIVLIFSLHAFLAFEKKIQYIFSSKH